MKKLLGVVILLALLYLAFDRQGGSNAPSSARVPAAGTSPAFRPDAGSDGAADMAIAEAFRQQRSDVAVSGKGVVSRVLADDHDGSPHQRFLLALANGQTVLVAHNIELAPRIDGLHEGDRVAFAGEYVWNHKGGVIHWTHRDPRGGHRAGWLRHGGRTYQ